MKPFNISSLNKLPYEQIRQVYARLIPWELLYRFNIPADLRDKKMQDLFSLQYDSNKSSIEMELFHSADFPDPILYGHITDTVTGQIHVLLYTLLDPTSPRFDIDRLPDGTQTIFGIKARNIQAETAALHFGLAPGQIRRGLRLLGKAILGFENFVASLGQDLYFAEPLFYHNAIIFESYGFNYSKGKKLMDRIQAGFTTDGDLIKLLDGSTPFRSPDASNSIRRRSWAIHDNILGEPFTNVTMYKMIGKSANISTYNNCPW